MKRIEVWCLGVCVVAAQAVAAERVQAAKPVDPPGRRIAILREPGVERQPGHADPKHLADLLRGAGFSPVFLRADDLCDSARFSRRTVDLLILPNAPFFPSAAVKNFRGFLKAGGCLPRLIS